MPSTTTPTATTPTVTAVPMALRVPGPLSSRNASYHLRVKLDETTHKLSGEGTLTWRNLERGAADRLVFHLYQNAFKSYASSFIVEAGPQLRGDTLPEHGFGSIDVTTLKMNGRDLLPQAIINDTLMTVPLDVPIGPSAIVEVELAWTVQLPKVFARSGWADSYHAVTQWFPKIGVFECAPGPLGASPMPECSWRAHQYHGGTEFFGDYGVYDVEINVPATTIVGATGVMVSETREGDRRRLGYHAEDVHDFAFFTDPNFIEVTDHIDDDHGGVAVRLLTRESQAPYTPRHLQALHAAFHDTEERLGLYPYSNITVIVPPNGGHGSGGMEYPTLFASFATPLPNGVRELEDTTAHEFIHQYFYGMLGNDEVEEAYLDEGITQHFTEGVMERYYSPHCSAIDVPYLCLGQADFDQFFVRGVTRRLPLSTPSYRLPIDLLPAMVYGQMHLTMRTLSRYLGEERMNAALRRYAERFRFRHPRKADLIAAMSEGAGEDLSWFFYQALDTTRVADYQVLSAATHEHELASGLWDCPPHALDPPSSLFDLGERRAWDERVRETQQAVCKDKPAGRHEWTLPRASIGKSALYDSDVVVQRRGDFIFPVEIVSIFQDGSSERTTWTLAEQMQNPEVRIKMLHFSRRNTRLLRADVDPNQQLVLDENRSNNGRFVEPQRRHVARLWLTIVGAVQTLFDLISMVGA